MLGDHTQLEFEEVVLVLVLLDHSGLLGHSGLHLFSLGGQGGHLLLQLLNLGILTTEAKSFAQLLKLSMQVPPLPPEIGAYLFSDQLFVLRDDIVVLLQRLLHLLFLLLIFTGLVDRLGDHTC